MPAAKPLLLAVDRLSLHDDRAQQDAECAGVRDHAALIGGHVSGERIIQSHARNEMIDDGQWAEALDQQARANHFACVPDILSLLLRKESESQESCHVNAKMSSPRRASASPAFALPSTPWIISVRERFSAA
jgi:hypothetical protein